MGLSFSTVFFSFVRLHESTSPHFHKYTWGNQLREERLNSISGFHFKAGSTALWPRESRESLTEGYGGMGLPTFQQIQKTEEGKREGEVGGKDWGQDR